MRDAPTNIESLPIAPGEDCREQVISAAETQDPDVSGGTMASPLTTIAKRTLKIILSDTVDFALRDVSVKEERQSGGLAGFSFRLFSLTPSDFPFVQLCFANNCSKIWVSCVSNS